MEGRKGKDCTWAQLLLHTVTICAGMLRLHVGAGSA